MPDRVFNFGDSIPADVRVVQTRCGDLYAQDVSGWRFIDYMEEWFELPSKPVWSVDLFGSHEFPLTEVTVEFDAAAIA